MTSNPKRPDNILATIGDLTVFKESIGSGAFASVHKAKYKGENCAAKLLLQNAKDIMLNTQSEIQDAARWSIEKECAFLYNLCHENVVQHKTTAIEPKSGLPIIAVELMDCNLRQFISTDKPLDLNLQLTICHGVSSGLHYLHSKNIIHRDLCDDNVLLTRPPNLKVKISDFGMSTILDYDSMSATMTAVGHRRGYLPPEGEDLDVNTSDGNADKYYDKACYSHHLDIYSFGAVATQIVQSAEHLKCRADLRRQFEQIAVDHPLKDIIAQCIDKDSKNRPQANEVKEFILAKLPRPRAKKRPNTELPQANQVNEFILAKLPRPRAKKRPNTELAEPAIKVIRQEPQYGPMEEPLGILSEIVLAGAFAIIKAMIE